MMFAMTRLASVRRFAAAATVALACLVPATTASAQFGSRVGFESDFQPDFLARDVTTFIQTLGLDELQRPILEMLLDDYRMSFEAGMADMREQMKNLQGVSKDASPEEVLKRVMAPIDDWAKKKAQLRDEFTENVKAQLSDQQKELWPKLERALRREKKLAPGEIQGESVDLLLVIRELQLTPQVLDSMSETLNDYESKLDAALEAREAKMASSKPKIQDAMQSQDMAAGLAVTEAIMALRVALRDVQDASRDQIREALAKNAGDSQAAEFEKIALERAYPKVYRADPILPLFEKALATTGITSEQKGRLDSLRATYENEVPGVNKELADAYRREEPKEPRRRNEAVAARIAGEQKNRKLPEPEALANARKAREDFYDRYRKAIMEILNPDQQAEMPVYAKDNVAENYEIEKRAQREAIRNAQNVDRSDRPQPPALSPNGSPSKRDDEKGRNPALKLKPNGGGGGRGGPSRTAE